MPKVCVVLGTSVALKKCYFSSPIGSWGCAVFIVGGGAASLGTVMALLAVSVRKEIGHGLLCCASTEAVWKACDSGDPHAWCRVS